jgi:type IV pilus assembly protein PilF
MMGMMGPSVFRGLMMSCALLVASGCANLSANDPQAAERARLRLALATGYFEQAQYAVALEEVTLALQAAPQSVEALNLRGLTLMRLSQPVAAQQSLEQALRLKPQDADTLHNLAWLRCQQGQFALADQGFEQALAQPGYTRSAVSWTSRGLCQLRAGQHESALQSLLRAQALKPEQALVTYNLGWILWRQGDFSRAQSYTRALNNSPQANAESLWLGLRVERALGQTQSVAQLADQLKKRYPMSAELQAYERGAFDE